jgi:hypothetical protein
VIIFFYTDNIYKIIEENKRQEEEKQKLMQERSKTSYFNSISREQREKIMSPKAQAPPVGHYKPVYIQNSR